MLNGSPGGKRIAFVSNSAWSVYNFRLDVILTLKQLGYEIIVIATKDEYAFYLTEAGCHFIDINFNNRTGNPLKDFFFYRKLKQVYSRIKPDFIFHYVTKPNIYGSLAAATLKIPCVAVITGLGYAFAKENWLNSLVKSLYTKALLSVKQAWFLNQEDADLFMAERIVSAEKIKVLPGEGLNTAHFSRQTTPEGFTGNRKFRFLMSTRLLKSKGVSVYADAIKILLGRGYAIDCRLIGFFEAQHPDSLTDDDLSNWEKQGFILYDGFAKDVRPHLEAADCFVFPSSYNEGIPRALLEAASMEVPVITSNSKGCREVVHDHETGFLSEATAEDFANMMAAIMKLTVEERMKMGAKGRQLVQEKFEVSRIIAIYKELLQTYI